MWCQCTGPERIKGPVYTSNLQIYIHVFKFLNRFPTNLNSVEKKASVFYQNIKKYNYRWKYLLVPKLESGRKIWMFLSY